MTGRLRVLAARSPDPEGAHRIGVIDWPSGRPDGLATELAELAAADLAEAQDIASWLAGLSHDRVDAMIAHLRTSLLHMAPVLLYTGDGCYTNLGKQSNLAGKSMAADSPRCLLNRLADTPVTAWSAQDATYLACLYALITSGPPVRAEEFSGTQLRPDRLERFLRERLGTYQAAVPDTAGLPVGERLQVLARATAQARVTVVRNGARPYRMIQGLNLNKQEHLSWEPVTLADVPAAVLEAFSVLLGCSVPGDFDALGAACADAMPSLHVADGDGFTSGFERVLHELVEVATEATGSDVGMSRGPRRVGELTRLVRQGGMEPLTWTTNAFYCCVTPSWQFVRHFAQVPDQLPQVLRAIAARMRYNGWHYLPHTLGVHERSGDRDWFFAPTMSDLTDWSDQHHTGHVANGVRYAIRVPFGITLAGTYRPGLHDFRLMRSAGQPYTPADLRVAHAIGEVLRQLYQAHADRLAAADPGADLDIVDFDNPWYQARYGRASTLQPKEEAYV